MITRTITATGTITTIMTMTMMRQRGVMDTHRSRANSLAPTG